jgi:hypothetical protein
MSSRRRKLAVGLTVLVLGLVSGVTSLLSPAVAGATTNACSNPVVATDLNSWGPLDGTVVSRDTVGDLAGASWAFDTHGQKFFMPQLSVTAGQTWTFAAQDRVLFASGTAKIAVDWYTAAGAFINEQTGSPVALPQSTLSGGTWTPVSATFIVPATAVTAHVVQYGDFGGATGTNFKATECDYELGASQQASVRYDWGADNPADSDEYNGTAVDLAKWGLFGAGVGQSTGCSAGFNGHGQRCASQTMESGGFLTVTGTTDGVTGGLYHVGQAFKYGRIEVRERAVQLPGTGAAYHAVPLLWPQNGDYTHAEIDFAERDVAAPNVDLFVHHDGTQTQKSVTIDSTQFHNYAIDWEPDSVTWYVDGNLVATVNATIDTFDSSNGGAQLDMLPATGPMRPAQEQVDWVHMFPVAATQYN